ncbi:MAG: MarC family protein [Verrucomicrobiota bacterium]|nr:MarC family protein [Verrucomicrobiota bacterium]
MTLLSATVLLLLVTDPLGNVPLFITCLKGVERSRQVFIIIREIFIAFVILALFLFFGKYMLAVLHLSESSLRLAGGIILFLIAIRMIFPDPHGLFGDMPDGEPFIFPLAVPLFAGPSAVATVLLFAAKEPSRLWVWFLALLLCCLISGIILGFSPLMLRVFGHRGLNAFEKLMGLLLAAIAVEMIVVGIREVVAM